MTTFIVEDLVPAQYMGWHGDLVPDQFDGLPARRVAFDFHSECELLATTCHVLPALDHAIPPHVRCAGPQPGHCMEENSGFQLMVLIDDINEKLTQWSSVAPMVRAEAEEFARQLASSGSARFEFYWPVRALEARVEHYCFAIVSILDLCARLATVFNRASPKKFGQQLEKVRSGKIWDSELCERLDRSVALAELRDYRNAIGHEVSLKLRPARVGGAWRPILVRTHLGRRGLVLDAFLAALRHDLLEYVRFLDGHFAQKAGLLEVLAGANTL